MEFRAVAKVHLLKGLLDHWKPPGSSRKDIEKHILQMIHRYSYINSSPKREKAIPLDMVIRIWLVTDSIPHT